MSLIDKILELKKKLLMVVSNNNNNKSDKMSISTDINYLNR